MERMTNATLLETETWAAPIRFDTALEIKSPYYLGYDVMDEFPKVLASYVVDRVFVISGAAVDQLYGDRLATALESHGIRHDRLTIQDNEYNKNFDGLSYLCEELVRRGVSRRSVLVAFGGGVIGNIVGLAAAMIYRGIGFVEMPTTLMGQTDSTLSNKQAVNGQYGKNHFGVYYAPLFIWSDTQLLHTEQMPYVRSGLVEAVKNGLICDPAFLDYLDARLDPALTFDPEGYHDLVHRIIDSKLQILRQDPSEKGYGMVLEYGHTFGHAIESIGGGRIAHGEAVAVGMCMAAELSFSMGLIDDGLRRRHYHLLGQRLGVDLRLDANVDSAMLMQVMASDNKRTGGEVKYVLLDGLGSVCKGDGNYLTHVPSHLVKAVIDTFPHRETSQVLQ